MPHRDRGSGRDHRRRPAAWAAHARVRRAGSGKTLFAMEFLVRGAVRARGARRFHGVRGDGGGACGKRPLDWASTSTSLLARICSTWTTLVSIRPSSSRRENMTSKGLFIRLGQAIDSLGARRVVLDSVETLFVGLSNAAILRAELRRLFHWLKEKEVTAVVTAERGDNTLTRQGLEEYVSDCVILLDHRVTRTDLHAPPADRQVPRLDPRHERVPVPDLRAWHLGIARHFAGARGTRRPTNASPPAFPGSTSCWAARGITGAAACWFPARPGRARPASPRSSPTRPAAGVSVASTSPPRSRRARWSGTCARSASTSSPGFYKGLLRFLRRPPHRVRPGDAPGLDPPAGA